MRETDVAVCGTRCRAAVAESFIDSLVGVHAVSPDVDALVIPGNSVHGFTLRRPMWVFGVDDGGDSFEGRVLHPRRVVRFRSARAVIEFPNGLTCEAPHESHTIRWSG